MDETDTLTLIGIQLPSPSVSPQTAALIPDLSFFLIQSVLPSLLAAEQRSWKTNDCACSSRSSAMASWHLRRAISSVWEIGRIDMDGRWAAVTRRPRSGRRERREGVVVRCRSDLAVNFRLFSLVEFDLTRCRDCLRLYSQHDARPAFGLD